MNKILIVDDDPETRSLLKEYLDEDSVFAASMAENGRDALESIGTDRPDLILLDLWMPVMDGISVTREIRTQPDLATLPIILLSGEGDKTKWIEALDAGANDFVAKPFNKSELLARINTHLKVATLTNELSRKNAVLEKERMLARRVQQNLLPNDLNFSGLTVDMFYRASNQIGGDFIDAWEKEGQVHVLIGDVSGHDTASALLMAACKGIFRSLGQTMSSPAEIVEEANRLFAEMASGNGIYLTMVYVLIERERDVLHVISAGHVPVFMIKKAGIQTIDSTGPLVGWDVGDSWETVSLEFSSGDTLFLYTDGLAETQNSRGTQYGDGRLQVLLSEYRPGPTMIEAVLNDVEQFACGSFCDDMTLVTITRGQHCHE